MINPAEVRLATAAMGARWELLVRGDPTHARAAGEACVEAIESLHARWTRFEPSSMISAMHRAAGEWTRVDHETREALAIAERWRAASDGALACASGPTAQGRPIEFDGDRVRVAPGTRIDLGAIAKGAALDAVTEIMRDAEVEEAFVHGGSSAILALGGPWRVAPANSEGAPGPTLELRDQVMAVSCSTPLHRSDPHVTDRRTGVASNARTVSAIVSKAGRGADADALATTLCVLGWPSVSLATSAGVRALVWSAGAWRDTGAERGISGENAT
ncbi:MAG: FAD:protein FMN transferase [Planctomycetota bacterium]